MYGTARASPRGFKLRLLALDSKLGVYTCTAYAACKSGIQHPAGRQGLGWATARELERYMCLPTNQLCLVERLGYSGRWALDLNLFTGKGKWLMPVFSSRARHVDITMRDISSCILCLTLMLIDCAIRSPESHWHTSDRKRD